MKKICTLPVVRYLLILLVLLCQLKAGAQIETPPLPDESNTSASGAASASDQYENLEYYRTHPIDLNTAERAQLDELHILSPLQIEALMRHRVTYGAFLEVYELQSIPGFTTDVIRSLLPYIKVHNEALSAAGIKRVMQGASHTLSLFYEQPLQQADGFLHGSDSLRTNDYLGHNFKTTLRYRYSNGSKLSMGFNADNDVGEPFFNKKQPGGFDFYSAHLFIRDVGIIKQLALGDYHLNLGQGLAVGTGFVLNKSIEVLQIRRYATGLRPYRSINEFGFFRGGAVCLGNKFYSATIYVSAKKTDGNTIPLDTTLFEAQRYYSLITSGYHRTEKELALKHTSTQKAAGMYLQTDRNAFHAGAGWMVQQLNSTLHTLHADISYSLRNVSFFSEVAGSNNGGRAMLAGLMASLHATCDMAMVYRNYNASYTNTLSNAFSNASTPTNEKGLYTGITLKLRKGFRLLGYLDVFASPLPKYRVDFPSHGNDAAGALQFIPTKALKLECRYRIIRDQINATRAENENMVRPADQQKTTLRLQCDYAPDASWKFRTRCEFVKGGQEYSPIQFGTLAFQDLSYQPVNGRWEVTLRYCLFQSGGSYARMYAFENDVPYAFSLMQFNDTGSRAYLLFSCRLRRGLQAYMRISDSFYPQKTFLSSGLSKINGPHQTDVKMVVKYVF